MEAAPPDAKVRQQQKMVCRVIFFRNRALAQAFPTHISYSEESIGLMRRSVDKERIARADRVARLLIDAEREARDSKTLRLRELRLKMEAELLRPPPKARPRTKPAPRKTARVIEVE